MIGAAAAPLPPGGTALDALPPAQRSERVLRLLLVLGGCAAAFWLLGMLLGSQHATAADAGSTSAAYAPVSLTGPLHSVSRAAATPVQSAQGTHTHAAQNVVPENARRPAHKVVAAARHALSTVRVKITTDLVDVTGSITATVHEVGRQLPALIPDAVAADPAPHRAGAGTRLPVPQAEVHRAATVAQQASAPPAGVPTTSASGELARRLVVPALNTEPLNTSPDVPAPPADPTVPAAPSAPGTGDGHEFGTAVLPSRAMLPRPLAVPAASDGVQVDDSFMYDPSFSPD